MARRYSYAQDRTVANGNARVAEFDDSTNTTTYIAIPTTLGAGISESTRLRPTGITTDVEGNL